MKNLLYITTNLKGTGGVSRVLSVKLNYLIENYSYKISVFDSNNFNNGFFYDFNDEIGFYFSNSKNIFEYKRQLNNVVSIVNPDIIINCDNGLKGSLLPFLINERVPLVYERHCSKNISVKSFCQQFKLKLSNFFLEKSINEYKSFIVLNKEEKKNWNGSNLEVITNPLWFNLSSKSKKSDNKVVVAVGRHSYEKRYDKLINIWNEVSKEHPDWILKIYGKKNDKIPLEKLALDKNILSTVEFNNPIDDIEKLYSEVSMLLTTSESESFGLVLIEAMAYGIPVIAYATTGSNNIIINGFNGFVVKQNDEKKYIEKINILIKNRNFRNQMGENAKSSLGKYDIDSIMIEWHNLFMSI